MSILRGILIILLGILISNSAYSGLFKEHQEIGDEAFREFEKERFGFIQRDSVESIVNRSFLDLYYGFKKKPYMIDSEITYGELNGLALEHAGNPIELREEIAYDSRVIRILRLHRKAIDQKHLEASHESLSTVDPLYLSQKDVDFDYLSKRSHFYEFDRDFDAHCRRFRASDVDKILALTDLIKTSKDVKQDTLKMYQDSLRVLDRLGRENIIVNYLAHHIIALELSYRAGWCERKAQEGEKAPDGKPYKQRARNYFANAVVFNSFADHFIQDAFSARHLFFVSRRRDMFLTEVGRNVSSRLELYDYYGTQGVSVVSLGGGQPWIAFGDGSMNKAKILNLRDEPDEEGIQKPIKATKQSLEELFDAFREGFNSTYPHVTTETLENSPIKERIQRWRSLEGKERQRKIRMPYHKHRAVFYTQKQKIIIRPLDGQDSAYFKALQFIPSPLVNLKKRKKNKPTSLSASDSLSAPPPQISNMCETM